MVKHVPYDILMISVTLSVAHLQSHQMYSSTQAVTVDKVQERLDSSV